MTSAKGGEEIAVEAEMVRVLEGDRPYGTPIEAEDAGPGQGQQNGRVGGHDELGEAAAGYPAEEVTQLQLSPGRECAFGLVEQIQALHSVAALEERHVALTMRFLGQRAAAEVAE